MVAKLSSSSTRLAASRATSVPPRPMATPMSARLQRRRVVDAVAGHGDELARAPAAPRRCGSSAPGRRARRRAPGRTRAQGRRRPARPARRRSAPRPCSSRDDAQPARNGARRGRVVAGDHHRRDAGAQAVAHRGGGLRPRRVDQADQADQRAGPARSACASAAHVGSAASSRRASASTRKPCAASASACASTASLLQGPPRRRRAIASVHSGSTDSGAPLV